VIAEVGMKKMKKEVDVWITTFLSRTRLLTDIVVKI
jgi:hypothetical protein